MILVEPLPTPAKEVLKSLQLLMDGVKEGKYIGYAAVGIKPGGGCDTFRCGPTTGLITTLGAVTALQYDLSKLVVDE